MNIFVKIAEYELFVFKIAFFPVANKFLFFVELQIVEVTPVTSFP